MEKVLFTALSKQDLEALVIDCVQVCLKKHAPQPARDTIPDEAAPPFVSKKEAARLLSCSPSSIDNFGRSGKLTRHYVGGKSVRFERSQVLALAKSHTNHKQKLSKNGY